MLVSPAPPPLLAPLPLVPPPPELVFPAAPPTPAVGPLSPPGVSVELQLAAWSRKAEPVAAKMRKYRESTE
jgi:hypothetical protein